MLAGREGAEFGIQHSAGLPLLEAFGQIEEFGLQRHLAGLEAVSREERVTVEEVVEDDAVIHLLLIIS